MLSENNRKTLELIMGDYLHQFLEMVGNAKEFIISPDIPKYADQFIRETKQLVDKAERYSADSEVIQRFIQVYSDPKEYLLNLNKKYMDDEKEACRKMFNDIDGKSLDLNQRNAVVNDDLRQLVIAGAGSGKTLTVSAKVKYLVERRRVNPQDILLISFTRKAAEEMKERIGKIGIDIESSTFHKYGLSVIRKVNKKTPDVAENVEKYVDIYLKEIIFKEEKLAKEFLTLLGVLMFPVFDGHEKIGERIEAEQCQDLTTIKGMYEAYSNKHKIEQVEKKLVNLREELAQLHEKLLQMSGETEEKSAIEIQQMIQLLEQKIYDLQRQKRSIRNEKMKSTEEVMLANIFFLDGVEYEYESEYPYDESNNYHKRYRPDFYLKESNVYWEHFGIDKWGRAPQYSEVAEKAYLEGIKWKRNLHEANHTKLAETYSWQFKNNKIMQVVKANYKKFGIQKHNVRYGDVLREIMKGDSAGNIESFRTLLSTFISLFKSYGYSIDKFDELRTVISGYKDKELSKEAIERRKTRDAMFLDFAEKFYIFYSEALIKEGKIDFNDMILQAASFIEQGAYRPTYKYVIIDEYQDISVGRYKLAKATLEQSKAKLFCVGDDWQSIYRFTGSEVDLIVNFKNYFGVYSQNAIVQTYRNSQELLDISGGFIMSNNYQTPKKLKSLIHLDYPIRVSWYTGPYHPILEDESEEIDISIAQAFRAAVDEIVKKYPDGEILLLGRNNSDLNYLSEDHGIRATRESGEITVSIDSYPKVKMRFLTIHRAKGLEADNVIILNARNARTGFPNQIADDPVLNLLRDTEEIFPFAEERRLFYVALTRTRHYTYILAPITQTSRFLTDIKMLKENVGKSQIKDISSILNNGKELKKPKSLLCPICKVGTLVKRKGENGKEFVGCSNYPTCTYTASDLGIIRNNNRCPVCGNFLTIRKGSHGEFIGCMGYPYCTYTTNIAAEDSKPKPTVNQDQDSQAAKYANIFAYNSGHGKPLNSHIGWTVEEDHKLIKEYNSGKTIGEMAKAHQRTNGGISARLQKLGLLKN